MKAMTGFIKKEWMEVTRSGKLYVTLLLFLFFGILNPAIAKLTPVLLASFSESLKEQGITMTKVTVNALTSWQQYYKNLPLEMLLFLLLFAGFITNEYQKKTFLLLITKGLKKTVILGSKILCLFLLFTSCYWLTFAVTFAYNGYFWDNSIAKHILTAAAFYYLFGLFLISVMIFFSTIFDAGLNVLLGQALILIICYALELYGKTQRYTPFSLCSGMNLLEKKASIESLYPAMLITIILIVVFLIFSFLFFQKKEIH